MRGSWDELNGRDWEVDFYQNTYTYVKFSTKKKKENLDNCEPEN